MPLQMMAECSAKMARKSSWTGMIVTWQRIWMSAYTQLGTTPKQKKGCRENLFETIELKNGRGTPVCFHGEGCCPNYFGAEA
jgi:hypothetical protein